jgi:1-acyl-sn-glycerol-3-phosphate acyltransferase
VLGTLGVRLRVRGAILREPSLLVANHLSWTDIVAVLATHECTFVAKHEVRRWPIVGWLGMQLGVIWTDRSTGRSLLRTIADIETTLRGGTSVLLFAEGTTGDGAQLLPFKSSLVEAACRAGAPVVPLAISATALPPVDALCWVGDETLLQSIPRVQRLSMPEVQLHAAPPIAPMPCRKLITQMARDAVARRTRGGAIRARGRSGADGAMMISVAR